MGCGSIVPCILNLGGKWLASCPCHCTPGRLGGPQNWSGHGGEEKKILPVLGI